MADSFLALADLVKINSADLADRDISDILDDAPVLRRLAADYASNGTTHKYVKETGAPTVGFRSVNDGRENSKSTDTEVSLDLKILDATTGVDKALADAYRRGPDAYVAREAVRHLKAAFFKAEQQIIGGTVSGDASGFTGLADDSNLDGLADDMVVDAGGTTASTGSSVWAIRSRGDLNDCVAIMGQDGMIDVGETSIQRLDGATGTYPAYYTPITAWMGLQVGGKYSVGRLANITADVGKTLTDDLLAELYNAFPAGKGPDFFCMSRRSLLQLQQSRTATNPTGAPAPFPAFWTGAEGSPVGIIVTESIGNTETLLV